MNIQRISWDGLQRAWSAKAAFIGAIDAQLPGPQDTLDTAREEERVELLKHFANWLMILDFAILNLASHVASLSQASDRRKDERLLSVRALLSHATQHAIGIRHCCIAGLDGPSRVLLRSLVEALTMAFVCACKRDIAAEYIAAQGPDESREVWRRYFTIGKLRPILEDIDRQGGLEAEVSADMLGWWHSSLENWSKFSHGAYVPILMSVWGRPPSTPDTATMTVMGRCTIGLLSVLDQSFKWCALGLIRINHALTDGPTPTLVLDTQDPVDGPCLIGPSVLGLVAQAVWLEAKEQRQPYGDWWMFPLE